MSKHEPRVKRVKKSVYRAELRRLQAELVVMQQWVADTDARVVVIFEGLLYVSRGDDVGVCPGDDGF